MIHYKIMAMVTLLVMAAKPVFAANWVIATVSSNNSVFYYDADTIQRSGDQVTVWEKWDHSRDKTVKRRESKIRYRYDCAERTSTVLSSTSYYPDGTSETYQYPPHLQESNPIIPETVIEGTLEAVCAATAP